MRGFFYAKVYILVGLESMDYGGVGLERFDCSAFKNKKD